VTPGQLTMALRIVMFLVTAVVVGFAYRLLGGSPDLLPLAAALAGCGGLAAVELAARVGWL